MRRPTGARPRPERADARGAHVDHELVERIWFGRDAGSRAVRAALAPLGWLYAGGVAARGALYDRGALGAQELALPAISVGNLTVGGTGKTPIAADIVRRLRERGARPAVVLRGYGGDEPLVHARLNPGVVVVADADRVRAVLEAASQGADVAVLDDAFQHRRARRDADIVLVSADRWARDPRRTLPAGPWREPLGGLRRASLAVVTRKAANDAAVEAAVRGCRAAAPGVPVAVAHLAPGDLRRMDDPATTPLEALRGRRVLAIGAIGDPSAFHAQLAHAGASVIPRTFADHHAFTAAEARALANDARQADLAVCTLKDAVKLDPLWPRADRALWYVSQSVRVERGEDALQNALDHVLGTRTHPTKSRGR